MRNGITVTEAKNIPCAPGETRHSWTFRDASNLDLGSCRYCDVTILDHSNVKIKNPSRDWKIATAGYHFAEDLNSDGTLKSEDDS